MSLKEQSIREQAREYLHKVAHHDDNNYGNVFVIEGARIDGETALDMAELALLTQKPIAVQPVVTVAQALDLARRLRVLETMLVTDAVKEAELAGHTNASSRPGRRVTSKGGRGEDPTA